MSAIVEIDQAGRIVVPKKFRDALHLRPGTRLRIERSGDQLLLEEDFPEPRLEMRDGLLVMISGASMSADAMQRSIQEGYEEREQRIMEGSGLE